MDISKSVIEALHNKRKSQTWLAKQLQCSPSYVNAICVGDKMPSIQKLKQISDVIGIKASELIALGE